MTVPAFRTSFVRALSRRGYVLRNAQDGAHELYHALTCGLPLNGAEDEGGRRWQREVLNDAIESYFPGIGRWWNEVEARCVEQLVCKRLGRESELMTLDAALFLSLQEADHFHVPAATFAESKAYALKFMESKRARAAVDLLFAYALAEEKRAETKLKVVIENRRTEKKT